MITNYKIIGQVVGYLNTLSRTLQVGPYPVELLRNYRLVYEGINKLSGRLNNYKSTNQKFLEAREAILSDREKETIKPCLAFIDEPFQPDQQPSQDDGQSSSDSFKMGLWRIS